MKVVAVETKAEKQANDSEKRTEPEWVKTYYAQTMSGFVFSLQRRDTAINWSLTVSLGAFTLYLGLVTRAIPTAASIPQEIKAGILLATLAVVFRFFMTACLHYAFFTKWRHLRDVIQRYWLDKGQTIDTVEDAIKQYDQGRKVPSRRRQMVWSQIRGGFWLIFGIIGLATAYEVLGVPTLSTGHVIMMSLFGSYLVAEILNFSFYSEISQPNQRH